MPVFLRPEEAYKSQWDGDQLFRPLQLRIGRSWHYTAREERIAVSLTPPKHNAVKAPGVSCWEYQWYPADCATLAPGCWDF